MKLFPAVLALGAALLAVPAMADPTPTQFAAAKEAEARGAEIYAYDQAAWHSTDALQAELKRRGQTVDQVWEQGMRGYIVEPAEGGLLLVTYYGQKEGRTWAMARFWMAGAAVRRGGMLKDGDNTAMSALALTLVETRRKALDEGARLGAFTCGKGAVNTVVLPPRSDGTIPAYVLSSQTEAGKYPAGGHTLFVFDGKGNVISHRPFTKSCLALDEAAVPKEAQGFGVSHMLDPQPTEIHAFISYNVRFKLFVIIDPGDDLWEIDRGKITFKQVLKDAPK